MNAVRDEITIEIGNIIGRSANRSADAWDYAGYAFVAKDMGGTPFLYRDGELLDLETGPERRALRENFLRLREITRVEGDDYWIRCLAVVRNEDKKFRMLFEFNDNSRWEITPANVHDSYRILVGDAFPEEFE